ncbi:circadian associated repressor of transcription a isoform X2 [Pangasianodon hypophthalmus]|uniref:circadian associated repressor of transcription a isoform X2 n=1 Tax=Pangasianodon hypophthalmus TaxID=310915 RepID=UPI00147F6DC4|nr:circadian associated repressor of transcription a isoform X2 [Pangasianodon hypophthalmus]XP_034162402.1 circadian associated repressor of transcription a isoform X2 [Pangasianodon hypophthalmus]
MDSRKDDLTKGSPQQITGHRISFGTGTEIAPLHATPVAGVGPLAGNRTQARVMSALTTSPPGILLSLGLSSFQQSVAMDRIQRIVGVLQKPHIGEKYLPTLLQVEMMLKLWFPQVSLQPTGTRVSRQLSGQGPSSSSSTPPHKQKDQLHIPVKKRRLSWSDADSAPTPKGQKKEEQSHCLSVSSVPASHIDQSDKITEEKSGPKGLHWAEPGLTWVHVAPILSPPKSCPSLNVREGGDKDIRNGYFVLTPPPPGSRGSPATQDNSISSTTPCSEPVTYQVQPEMVTQTEGRSQSPPITEELSSLLQT